MTYCVVLQVKFAVLKAYLQAVGLWITLGIVFLYTLNNAAGIYANFWLSEWSDDIAINGTMDTAQRDLRLGVYGALGLAQGGYYVFIYFSGFLVSFEWN